MASMNVVWLFVGQLWELQANSLFCMLRRGWQVWPSKFARYSRVCYSQALCVACRETFFTSACSAAVVDKHDMDSDVSRTHDTDVRQS